MVTAQNAKLLTSYRKEIKSNILDQKYKYAIEGIEKEILWAAEEGRSYITWSYAVNEIYSPLIKELTQRGFRVECFEKKTTLLIYQYIGNMKLEYTDGCICTSLTVDGKETVDMTPEEIKVSIRAMLDRETDIATLQDVWMSLIEHLGEYKDLRHCECCGDWISNYTLEI